MSKEEAMTLYERYINWPYVAETDEAKKIQEEADNAVIALCKKLTNKKKKVKEAHSYIIKNVENGNDLIEEEMKPYRIMAKDLIIRHEKEKDDVKNYLINFAKEYNPEPLDYHLVIETARAGDYSSQGGGASRYAENSLQENLTLLKLLGYDAEIVEESKSKVGHYQIEMPNYALKANITQFDFWCISKLHFISVLNWAFLCWENGVNPKVYFPFLSQDDYDKSLYMSRSTSFSVTKENMSKELTWEEIKKLERKFYGKH